MDMIKIFYGFKHFKNKPYMLFQNAQNPIAECIITALCRPLINETRKRSTEAFKCQ